MRPSQHQKNTTDRVVYIDGVVEGVGVVVVGLSNSRGVLLVDFILVCRGCGGMVAVPLYLFISRVTLLISGAVWLFSLSSLQFDKPGKGTSKADKALDM